MFQRPAELNMVKTESKRVLPKGCFEDMIIKKKNRRGDPL